MFRVKVKTEEGFAYAKAELREDGWYINTVDLDGKGWRLWAAQSANKAAVRQLINKAYDERY